MASFELVLEKAAVMQSLIKVFEKNVADVCMLITEDGVRFEAQAPTQKCLLMATLPANRCMSFKINTKECIRCNAVVVALRKIFKCGKDTHQLTLKGTAKPVKYETGVTELLMDMLNIKMSYEDKSFEFDLRGFAMEDDIPDVKFQPRVEVTMNAMLFRKTICNGMGYGKYAVFNTTDTGTVMIAIKGGDDASSITWFPKAQCKVTKADSTVDLSVASYGLLELAKISIASQMSDEVTIGFQGEGYNILRFSFDIGDSGQCKMADEDALASLALSAVRQPTRANIVFYQAPCMDDTQPEEAVTQKQPEPLPEEIAKVDQEMAGV